MLLQVKACDNVYRILLILIRLGWSINILYKISSTSAVVKSHIFARGCISAVVKSHIILMEIPILLIELVKACIRIIL